MLQPMVAIALRLPFGSQIVRTAARLCPGFWGDELYGIACSISQGERP